MRPYKTCALLLDLKGREIRIGATKDDQPITMERGELCLIRCDGSEIPSSATCLQIDSTQAVAALHEGDEVRMGSTG